MLMIHPLPHAFSPWKAALLMVNVPSVSMSKTALCYTVMSVHGMSSPVDVVCVGH